MCYPASTWLDSITFVHQQTFGIIPSCSWNQNVTFQPEFLEPFEKLRGEAERLNVFLNEIGFQGEPVKVVVRTNQLEKFSFKVFLKMMEARFGENTVRAQVLAELLNWEYQGGTSEQFVRSMQMDWQDARFQHEVLATLSIRSLRQIPWYQRRDYYRRLFQQKTHTPERRCREPECVFTAWKEIFPFKLNRLMSSNF